MSLEVCEYCDSKESVSHCCDCGKALCTICQNEDERGKVRCLSCSDLPDVPLTDEDIEDECAEVPGLEMYAKEEVE